ncbi:MAG: bacterioferritin [Candidatus Peregrinibacteria bacterium GW2011_GWC2_39_14]|nr:MAG: Ferritin Dps family protein [Candidatus Peregrinibacteria bacterium GW2011_GWA2_38_36]KKR05013.1 MAG: bacterioferritin [Candidatus Peregrinibacteria bacterium GW2011_GWC2_39_14]
MTKQEFIDLLNKDLSLEYAAAVQYIQHAAKMTGAQYQTIQKELIIHANEEIGHAISLADHIANMGGEPTLDIGPRETDKDSKVMLEQDLKGETDAVNRYKARTAQAEQLGEYGVKRALEDILIMEMEHEKDLKMALGL